MKVFKPYYLDHDKQRQQAQKYYVQFFYAGRIRRLPADEHRKTAEEIGRRIDDLVRAKKGNAPLPPATQAWLASGITPATYAKLSTWGLIDHRAQAAATSIEQHTADWKLALLGQGDTEKHASAAVQHVRMIADTMGMSFTTDISDDKVNAFLDRLRNGKLMLPTQVPELTAADGQPAAVATREQIAAVFGRSISTVDHWLAHGCPGEHGRYQLAEVAAWLRTRAAKQRSSRTSDTYLCSLKTFCRWMVLTRRATENPVAVIKLRNSEADRRRERRPLTLDEIAWLLNTTPGQPVRQGMTGPERSLCYRLAIETGLRAHELATLTRESFTLAGGQGTVTVLGAYSKNRKTVTLPLKADTAAEALALAMQRKAGAVVFPMNKHPRYAQMLKADLAAARQAWLQDAPPAYRKQLRDSDFLVYRNAAGKVADFHALRHTTGTLLAQAGVHPRVAQALMRHSTMELTMKVYTHVSDEQQVAAVAKIPDLTRPAAQNADARKAGGTTA